MNEKDLGRSNIWKVSFMEIEHSLHRLKIDGRECHTCKEKVECDWNGLCDSLLRQVMREILGVFRRPCKWA